MWISVRGFVGIGFFFLVHNFASAQNITKVSGRTVQVTLQTAMNFEVNEAVNVVDEFLEPVAKGRVIRVSSSGQTVQVELTEGNAQVGMTLEKATSEVATSKKTTSSASSQNLSSAPNPPPPAENYSYKNLSEEERRILDIGEITTGRYVAGGILGTYPFGLGIGHAVQGRYKEIGWVFTVGELAAITIMAVGLGDCAFGFSSDDDCQSSSLILTGVIGYIGFRIWEIIDVWAVPPGHNRRYREIRSRTQAAAMKFEGLSLVPNHDGFASALTYSF